MHYSGLLLGLTAFVSIGLFHPVVISCEYHFSYRIWPCFFLAGAVLFGISLRTENMMISSLLGVVACSCMWSILELFHQHKRVEKGWFKANPKYHPNVKQAQLSAEESNDCKPD